MKKITIKTDCLYFTSLDGENYKIDSHNGSGLFDVTNLTSGETKYLTSNEVKQRGGNVAEICDMLDLLKYADSETYYTDDDMNYISRQQLDRIPAEYRDDYYPVEFEVDAYTRRDIEDMVKDYISDNPEYTEPWNAEDNFGYTEDEGPLIVEYDTICYSPFLGCWSVEAHDEKETYILTVDAEGDVRINS